MKTKSPLSTARKIIRRIAIYLRVSTEDQRREGFSLENQRESDIAFIKQRFGQDVEIIEYSDVESGYSIVRENYVRLLKDCEQGKIDAIVVWRIDRFSRNAIAGLGDLSDLNKKLGILVYSVIEGEINLNDPNSKFITGMHLLKSEAERDTTILRVMPGMKRGARLGHYQGTRHPALALIYDKKEKKLELRKDGEVRLVQTLFKRVASGDSVRSTAKYLYEQGYRNRNGKPLGTALLCRTIKREIYCDGIYRWNGVVSEKPILEPIIDRATWQQANIVVSNNRSSAFGLRKFSRRDDSPYVLQGVLKCRFCGANLVGHKARLGFRYYVCSTYFGQTKAACRGQWIKAEPIEEQAKNILRTAVSSTVVLDRAKEETARMMAERNPDLLNGIRIAERQLSELDDNYRRLLDLRYKDAISVDAFKTENDRLVQEKQVIQQSLNHLRGKLDLLQTQNVNLEKIFGTLRQFDTIYEKLDFKAKKNLFNWVFEYAHAVCLGRRKPKYIDDHTLNEPFKSLLEVNQCRNQKNILINQQKASNIHSSPSVVR